MIEKPVEQQQQQQQQQQQVESAEELEDDDQNKRSVSISQSQFYLPLKDGAKLPSKSSLVSKNN